MLSLDIQLGSLGLPFIFPFYTRYSDICVREVIAEDNRMHRNGIRLWERICDENLHTAVC
jgi:hypothetical protein